MSFLLGVFVGTFVGYALCGWLLRGLWWRS